jgi:hypothetical protein
VPTTKHATKQNTIINSTTIKMPELTELKKNFPTMHEDMIIYAISLKMDDDKTNALLQDWFKQTPIATVIKHQTDRFGQLTHILNTNTDAKVIIAGKDGKHSLGIDIAKKSWDPQNYKLMEENLNTLVNTLKTDFSERVEFGNVGWSITNPTKTTEFQQTDSNKNPSVNWIHVWGANADNWNLKLNDKISGAGQADAMKNQVAGVFGICTMPTINAEKLVVNDSSLTMHLPTPVKTNEIATTPEIFEATNSTVVPRKMFDNIVISTNEIAEAITTKTATPISTIPMQQVATTPIAEAITIPAPSTTATNNTPEILESTATTATATNNTPTTPTTPPATTATPPVVEPLVDRNIDINTYKKVEIIPNDNKNNGARSLISSIWYASLTDDERQQYEKDPTLITNFVSQKVIVQLTFWISRIFTKNNNADFINLGNLISTDLLKNNIEKLKKLIHYNYGKTHKKNMIDKNTTLHKIIELINGNKKTTPHKQAKNRDDVWVYSYAIASILNKDINVYSAKGGEPVFSIQCKNPSGTIYIIQPDLKVEYYQALIKKQTNGISEIAEALAPQSPITPVVAPVSTPVSSTTTLNKTKDNKPRPHTPFDFDAFVATIPPTLVAPNPLPAILPALATYIVNVEFCYRFLYFVRNNKNNQTDELKTIAKIIMEYYAPTDTTYFNFELKKIDLTNKTNKNIDDITIYTNKGRQTLEEMLKDVSTTLVAQVAPETPQVVTTKGGRVKTRGRQEQRQQKQRTIKNRKSKSKSKGIIIKMH